MLKKQIKIAIIQTKIFWEDIQSNLNKYDLMLGSLEQEVDIIFFPEMFNSGFSMHVEKIAEPMTGTTVSWLKKTASEKKAAIVASLAIKEKNKFYNRLIWSHPTGRIDYYDKRHTFTLAGEGEFYSKGKFNEAINFLGWKFLPQICYDLRFPVWSRNNLDYDALVYLANWPEPRISHWNKLLAARAIENMSYCIGVNVVGSDPNNKYVGDSCVIDPGGELCTKKTHEETIIYCELNKDFLNDYRKKLRFLDDKDDFTLNL